MSTTIPGKMPIEVQHQIALHNSFGVAAFAQDFVRFEHEAQLCALVDLINTRATNFMVLGGASNVLLVADKIQRLIVHNQLSGIFVVSQDKDEVEVAVSAGENWHQFVQYCIKQNFYGLENLALIPGNVGAAPVQNIGAYGVEVSQYISKVRCFDFKQQEIVELTAEQCQFSYRNSVFKKSAQRYLILEVFFRLKTKFIANLSYKLLATELEKTGLEITARSLFETVIAIRQSKLPDPKVLGNAGSFFQNPIVDHEIYQKLLLDFPNLLHFPTADPKKVKLSAGQLIELCGLKGKKRGNVGMYEKQALILVNYGGATGSELFDYACYVQACIAEKFGISLLIEPFVID